MTKKYSKNVRDVARLSIFGTPPFIKIVSKTSRVRSLSDYYSSSDPARRVF